MQTHCVRTLQNIQYINVKDCDKYADLMYGFAIGGADDFGMVMEGRGFSYMGSHDINYNRKSVSVGLIGEFDSMIPGESF